MRWFALISLMAASAAACAQSLDSENLPTVWRLESVETVGGLAAERVGAPRILGPGEGLGFDGLGDGMTVPVNPVAGCAGFTIEVLIRPDVGGPEEQRYFHVEDTAGRRGLLELRMVGAEAWCLDTFLKCRAASLVLIDRAKTHPAGRWTWVALRYDGRALSAWVDGAKELEGALVFGPMGAGSVSIGMRQDGRSWFRGAIREVRFSREPLPPERMQRTEK